LITGALYALFAGGLLLARLQQCKTLLLVIRTRRRLYIGNRVARTGALDEHLAALLHTVFKRRYSTKLFRAVSGLVFLCMLLAGLQSMRLPAALSFALAAGAAPYCLLRLRAETIRRRGSEEGERLVAAFLNQYRIENYNIYETIDALVAKGTEFRVCGRYLFKLLLEIRNAGNGEKLRRAADAFARAIDTNWSRMLAYNIRLAAGQGMNVSLGIEDILVQLRDARAVMEETKRLNAESSRIVGFFVPFLYLGLIGLSTRFLDLPLSVLMRNQLGTPEGFTLLVLIILLFVANVILIELVTHQKMDY
jgi:competence protein ComGC